MKVWESTNYKRRGIIISDSWDEGPRPPTILKLPQKNRNKTLEKSLTSNRVKERHRWGSPKPTPHFSDETAEAQEVQRFTQGHTARQGQKGTRPGRTLFLFIDFPVKREKCSGPFEAELKPSWNLQEVGFNSKRKSFLPTAISHNPREAASRAQDAG